MDLSVRVGDTKLKIRVAAIVSTPVGFLFEKSDKNYIFPIGGKIMINETSLEAVAREIKEEIGMEVENPTFIAVMENFYDSDGEKVHEICFVYKTETVFKGIVPDGFVEVSRADLDKFDIVPTSITDILKGGNEQFRHIMIKHNNLLLDGKDTPEAS